MNRACGPDGRWTVLDARPLLAALMEADAVYRATYQRHLTERLGLEWVPPDEHGNCELAGVPDDVIRHFSKAAARIEEECAEREAQGLATTAPVRSVLAHKLSATRRCPACGAGGRPRQPAKGGICPVCSTVVRTCPDLRHARPGRRDRGVRPVGCC